MATGAGFDRRAALAAGLALAASVVPVAARASRGGRLLAAVENGDLAAAERLIAEGASLETRDASGRTPLLLAVHFNHVEIARRLIAAGADVNGVADNRDTPWLLAGARGRTEILGLMLDKGGIDYGRRNRFGGTALIPACHYGHVETVRLLLARSKIDVDHVNDLGWTALLEAIILGDGGDRHTEIVRLLVEHGANPNRADGGGVMPLAHARARGQAGIVRILETRGARAAP